MIIFCSYDGLSMLPAYVPPEVPLGNLTVDSGDKNTKIYTGNCHCGAVKIAIKSKPLPEVEVKEDDCSICRRVNVSNTISYHLF